MRSCLEFRASANASSECVYACAFDYQQWHGTVYIHTHYTVAYRIHEITVSFNEARWTVGKGCFLIRIYLSTKLI